MADCKFSIDFDGSASELVAQAREAVQASGGTFEGDDNSGRYRIPTPVGRIEGKYVISGQQIRFEIDRKPVFVSCSKIEQELRRYLQGGVVNLEAEWGEVGIIAPEKRFLVQDIRVMPVHKIGATLNLYIEDEKAFDSDGTLRGTKYNSITLSSSLPKKILELIVALDAEMRIEFSLTAQILDLAGTIAVEGKIELFESTSQVKEPDRQHDFRILVVSNSVNNYTVRINNDSEGGDFAIAMISVSNEISELGG